MKTHKKVATSKLLASFDNELRSLLMDDLKAIKKKGLFTQRNNQVAPQTLAAA